MDSGVVFFVRINVLVVSAYVDTAVSMVLLLH